MNRRVARVLYGLPLLLGLFGLSIGAIRGVGNGPVVVLTATGVVDNVMAGYISEGVRRATDDGASAVVIRLNTPGGGLEATYSIVGTLLEADVPTIVWVAPAGGRAASAGTFITLASHVAVMAPGTNIGAASPVLAGGGDIPETLRDKVFNDTVAKARSIAEERGRNVEWAVSTVEEAVSSAASEAVEIGAVDGIAASLDEVLAFADGREVTIDGTPVTLDVAGKPTDQLDMNPFQAFLHLLSDPNIAALLFSVGSLGLIYELMSPNFVTGILGAIAIILAFIGSDSLPLNVAGLLLIGLAMLLFVLEWNVVSHGLLTVGALVCFALGLSALYTVPGDPFGPIVGVAAPLIAFMTATFGIIMVLVTVAALRTRKMAMPGLAGIDVGRGMQGVVKSPLEPLGSVHIAGEEWTARSVDDRPIARGTQVKVVAVDGLTVLVEPDPQPSQG
ncbi:MAG TPA: nodulation protein NfeD [Candidatus Limnocylindrales bacterium]|nr:nodulation protein NfeD [Candidatus Limnocylindrales bacterium]